MNSFFKAYHPRLLFILGFFSYCLGIGFSNDSNIIFGVLSGVVCVFLCVFYLRLNHWIIIVSLLGFFGFGLCHSNIQHQQRLESYLFLEENIFNTRQEISGRVDRQMYTTERSSVYRFLIDNFDTKVDNFDTPSTLSISIEVPKNLDIHTGEYITFTSTPRSSFSNIYSLSWFEKYAWYHRIFGKAFVSGFESEKNENPPLRDEIQEGIKSLLFFGFPKEVTAILLGITVGNTDFMSSEMKADFQASGLTHILVVSGSNITFLILFLWFFIKYIPLGRWIKRAVIVWFLLFYGYIVGWDVPVIRATVMGIIGYLATTSGHRRSVIATLFAIAWWILIFSPLALLYDAGFGLSFAATLGIIVFYTPFQNFFTSKLPFVFEWFFTVISITLAASIGSFPVLLYHFGQYPIASLPANFLVGPVMWILLACTLFYIIFSLFFSGSFFLLYGGYSIYFIVEWILFVAHFFNTLPVIILPTPLKNPIALLLLSLLALYIFSLEKKKLLRAK